LVSLELAGGGYTLPPFAVRWASLIIVARDGSGTDNDKGEMRGFFAALRMTGFGDGRRRMGNGNGRLKKRVSPLRGSRWGCEPLRSK
jgi:hypothetical protein